MSTSSTSSTTNTSNLAGVNRMSGLMSGLDTESLVKAMAANSLNRYNRKASQLQTLQWKQEIYRNHISSLSSFQSKYLTLSSKTALSNANLAKSKATSSNDLVTASASTSAKAATYTITESTAASKSSVTGQKNVFEQAVNLNFDKFNTTQNITDTAAALATAESTMDTEKAEYNTALTNFSTYMSTYISDNGITISAETQTKLDDINTELGSASTEDEKYTLLNSYANTLYGVIKASDGGLTDFAADSNYEANQTTLNTALSERTTAISAYNTAKSAYDTAVKLDNNGAGLATTIKLTLDGTVHDISISATTDKANAVSQFQSGLSSINTNLSYDDATGKLTLADSGDGIHHSFSVAYNTNIGLSSAAYSDTTTAVKIGSANFKNMPTPDADGNYNLSINGKDFSFKASTTIASMMTTINDSGAGVTMSFSSFNQNFKIENNNTGTSSAITLGGNLADSLFGASADRTSAVGTDSSITVSCDGGDAVKLTSKSNSYTFDGTTIDVTKLGNFTSGAGVDPITVTTSKYYSSVKDFIVNFVSDYNTLIDGVRSEMTTKRPKSSGSYYDPLTDEQKEEMDTDEIKDWEATAKKGLLYNDNYLNRILTDLRSSMGSSINGVTLADMGISSKSWEDYGKLAIDESKLDSYIAQNGEKVADFFTNTTNGLSKKLNNNINSAVSTTAGKVGYLAGIAGVEGTSTERKSSMYIQINSLQKMADNLKEKYESEMDSYWKRFTNLETYLSKMNAQASIFATE